jgi:hypothetical protein
VRSASSFLFIKLSDSVENQVDILSYSMSPIFVSSSTGSSENNADVNETVPWDLKGVLYNCFATLRPHNVEKYRITQKKGNL